MILCQITDLHIMADGKKPYRIVDTTGCLRRCIAQINRLNPQPDALVLTGDLVDSGLPEDYAFLRQLLQPLVMPYYLLPGNHDDRNALRAVFPDHAYLHQGGDRINYVIDDYPLRIVALDTVITHAANGALDPASLVWLDQVLGALPTRPTVILMHHPPFKTGIDHMDEIGLAEPEALARVVRLHPQVERILCGHLHRSIYVRFGGTIASTCPSTAHQVALNLNPQGASQFVMEPPAFQLHLWNADTGLVTHTVYIGEFDGPYSF